MKMRNSLKKGFTLAEVIISLTILGIIAAIVIPSTLRNTTTRTNKAKLRKALVSYDKAINNMIIENGLQRSTAVLNEYAYRSDNCANIRRYFKVADFRRNKDANGKPLPGDANIASYCAFRGVDGLWWDFGHQNGQFNIARARVAFEEKYLDDDAEATGNGYNAFILVTSFDGKGNLRINDVSYETVSGTQATQQETQKVIAYLDGDKNFNFGGNNNNSNKKGFEKYCQCNTVNCCSSSCAGQECIESTQNCDNEYRSGSYYNYFGYVSISGTCTRNRFFSPTGDIFGVIEGYQNENGMYANTTTLDNYGGVTWYKVDPTAKTITFAVNCGGDSICDAQFDANGNLVKIHIPYWGDCTSSKPCGMNPNPMETCKSTLCTYNRNKGVWEQGNPETDNYVKMQLLLVEEFVKTYGNK